MRKVYLLLAVITLIGTLPAQAELRYVHRASEIGGTGMLFQRIGDQLDPGEMNASVFVDYLNFDKLALSPTRISSEPYIDDPRGDGEIWATLTYNYGINDIVELGVKIPTVFGGDMRDDGVGRIGVDGRLLILNSDRMGGGISATAWLDAPSFQKNNSSNEINGGFELNFTLKGSAFTNYLGSEGFDKFFLEPMALYATMGYGYEDYLEFDDTRVVIDSIRLPRDPLNPQFVGTQVLYGSFGAEFEVYDHLFVGTELLFRQYPDYHNDNNTILIFPEISYTYNDRFTVQAAFGFTGVENQNPEDDQPKMLGKIGFTYHFPEFYSANKTGPANPARPRDLYEIFMPSRKPTPTQTQDQEVPLPEDQ